MKEINLKDVNLPGWAWVAVIVVIVYLAKTFITDSVIVELIVIGAFAAVKTLDLEATDVSKLLDTMTGLVTEANHLLARLEALRSKNEGGEIMRSGTVASPPLTEVPEVRTNRWVRWMWG